MATKTIENFNTLDFETLASVEGGKSFITVMAYTVNQMVVVG